MNYSSKQIGTIAKLFLRENARRVEEGDLSAATYGVRLVEIKRLLEWSGLHRPASWFGPDRLREYRDTVLAPKLGRRSQARSIAFVRQFLRWAYKNEMGPKPRYGTGFDIPSVTPTKMRQVKSRTGEGGREKVATPDQIHRLIEKANPVLRAMVLLGVNAGLSPGDVADLRLHHVNFGTGELTYPRTKNAMPRRAYLWKKTRRAIEAAIEHQERKVGPDDRVFLTQNGKPYVRISPHVKDEREVSVSYSNIVSVEFRKLTKRAGVEGLTFYGLRHTFRTYAAPSGDLDAIRMVMGHTRPGMDGVYDHSIVRLPRLKRVAKTVYRTVWPKQEAPA